MIQYFDISIIINIKQYSFSIYNKAIILFIILYLIQLVLKDDNDLMMSLIFLKF